jgi:hypothetical protein
MGSMPKSTDCSHIRFSARKAQPIARYQAFRCAFRFAFTVKNDRLATLWLVAALRLKIK